MFKRIVLAVVLVAILATGTVFANDPRPEGFGIGVVAGAFNSWDGGSADFGRDAWRGGLALHTADIYWGIRAGGGSNWIHIDASGDFMTLFGGNIEGPLGWYIDVGLYGGVGIYSPPSPASGGIRLDFGARLPIGLNLNFGILDIWLAIVPTVGLGINTIDNTDFGIGGGWGPEFGIRLWL